jgi:hypothetical protein
MNAELNESTRRILLERCNAMLAAANFQSPTQQQAWQDYRNALQDMDTTVPNPVFPATPNEPTFPLTAEQLTQRTRKDDARPYAATIPDWSTWTPAQVDTNITNLIFSGKTLAQVETDIDNLPATIAGMKTGLKSAAAQIITIRNILIKMGQLEAVLRDETFRF